MANGSLQLGPLQLQAPLSWTFHPFGKTILARSGRRGNLQITLAYANDVPADFGHKACVDVLRRYIDEPTSKVVCAEQIKQPDAIFGFVTIHDAKLFRRYWYRFKNDRFVLALYQCSADSFADAREEIEEAGAIAATMQLEV